MTDNPHAGNPIPESELPGTPNNPAALNDILSNAYTAQEAEPLPKCKHGVSGCPGPNPDPHDPADGSLPRIPCWDCAVKRVTDPELRRLHWYPASDLKTMAEELSGIANKLPKEDDRSFLSWAAKQFAKDPGAKLSERRESWLRGLYQDHAIPHFTGEKAKPRKRKRDREAPKPRAMIALEDLEELQGEAFHNGLNKVAGHHKQEISIIAAIEADLLERVFPNVLDGHELKAMEALHARTLSLGRISTRMAPDFLRGGYREDDMSPAGVTLGPDGNFSFENLKLDYKGVPLWAGASMCERHSKTVMKSLVDKGLVRRVEWRVGKQGKKVAYRRAHDWRDLLAFLRDAKTWLRREVRQPGSMNSKVVKKALYILAFQAMQEGIPDDVSEWSALFRSASAKALATHKEPSFDV